MVAAVSLRESAASGKRLDALADLRDVLAERIESCDSLRDLAALSARLQSVLAEIDELQPAEQKGDAVDEIAKRRAARRAGGSTDQARAKGSG